MNLLRYGIFATLLLLVVVGCGSSKQVAIDRRSAQQAFDEGVASFAKKDYEPAMMHLDHALETPGLYPDLFTEAHVKRAICAAALGDIPSAIAELDEMARIAPELDLVYAARSYVFAKQGKKKAAKAAWVKARRINRAVEKFTD